MNFYIKKMFHLVKFALSFELYLSLYKYYIIEKINILNIFILKNIL